MKYINFTLRLPESVLNAFDAESNREYRSRSQMLLTILLERYPQLEPIERLKPGRPRAAPIKRKSKPKAVVN
jgi:metal-responsive CopG/Arc/MetJ family transcriptional regulator